MTTTKRKADPNTIHNVKLNILEEVKFFRDEEDKSVFVDFLKAYATIYSMNIYFYSLVGKDIDICFHDEKGQISIFIQCVKSRYCKGTM